MALQNAAVQVENAEREVETAIAQLRVTNGFYFCQLPSPDEGGFFSSLFSRFIPGIGGEGQRGEDEVDGGDLERDQRHQAVQTEMDPHFVKTVQLTYLILQEQGLSRRIPSSLKDEEYRSLGHAISTMLNKQPQQILGMVNRIKLMDYRLFPSLADELFELNADNHTGELRISWARIVALYAFAVRLSQENINRPERVNLITRLLATYMTSHVLHFVRNNGGWRGLTETFPPPAESGVIKNLVLLWSGVFAVAAIFYFRSYFRKR